MTALREYTFRKVENMDLNDYRKEIDSIDEQIVSLFSKRMEIAKKIGEYKKKNGLEVLDSKREEEKLKRISELAGEKMQGYCLALYDLIMETSRDYQKNHMYLR